MRRALALVAGVAPLMMASCLPVVDGQELDLAGQQVHLTILHTADIHSRLIPYDFTPIKTVDPKTGQ